MKLKTIIYTALMLAFAAAAPSCINDAEGDCNSETPGGKVRLRLNLNMGDMGHLSRDGGVWNPSTPADDGNTFDNTIKTNDADTRWLHVMLINDAGELLHLNLEEGFQLNPTTGGYDMTAELDLTDRALRARWKPGTYRIMVLANFREKVNNTEDLHVSAYTTLADLKTAIHEHSVNWYNEDKTRNTFSAPNIPMWGMTTATLKLEHNLTDTFSVELLRAVAKVKILLTDKLKEAGYEIVECEVDNINQALRYMPAGWDTATKTADTSGPAYDASFHENADYRLTSMLVNGTFHPKVEDDGDGSLVFYLPEWSVKDGSALESNVTIRAVVKNDVGDNEECYMTISNESLGLGNYAHNRYNVNRNHLYRFTIDKEIQYGEFSYMLDCWNYVQSEIGWNPQFNFTTSDTEALFGYVSFPSYNSSDSEKKMLIENTTSYADYYFTLSSPPGAVWKAFLVEDGIEYTAEDKFTENLDGTIGYDNPANTPNGFFFGVGNSDGSNQKAASTGVARAEPY
ncbi:MAG: hypothetical protein K2M12_05645, partial [Muribaculaceae bacterium]|nr:hypothetical protein [Muribaculaceae bacterium]